MEKVQVVRYKNGNLHCCMILYVCANVFLAGHEIYITKSEY